MEERDEPRCTRRVSSPYPIFKTLVLSKLVKVFLVVEKRKYPHKREQIYCHQRNLGRQPFKYDYVIHQSLSDSSILVGTSKFVMHITSSPLRFSRLCLCSSSVCAFVKLISLQTSILTTDSDLSQRCVSTKPVYSLSI